MAPCRLGQWWPPSVEPKARALQSRAAPESSSPRRIAAFPRSVATAAWRYGNARVKGRMSDASVSTFFASAAPAERKRWAPSARSTLAYVSTPGMYTEAVKASWRALSMPRVVRNGSIVWRAASHCASASEACPDPSSREAYSPRTTARGSPWASAWSIRFLSPANPVRASAGDPPSAMSARRRQRVAAIPIVTSPTAVASASSASSVLFARPTCPRTKRYSAAASLHWSHRSGVTADVIEGASFSSPAGSCPSSPPCFSSFAEASFARTPWTSSSALCASP
mmetsp:Transcript_17501/g.57250  ORF Transcript_17501/g.57250 Transcript_17501/m.57250 type:complete len:282 (-) Transcript_17501:893-1738(-)